MVRGVNVIRGSKPPIEASSTPQNVTDTTFDTKILKHVFKNIQLLILLYLLTRLIDYTVWLIVKVWKNMI